MPQRHLVAVQLFGSGVERAPAHLGAEGAGILLVPVVEDDGADKSAAHLVRHIVPPEQRFQRGVIHRLAAKLGVEGDGHDFEREADQNPVAGGQHLVLLDGFAHQAAEPLHRFRVAHDRLTLSTRLTMSLMEASLVRPET